MAQPVKDVGVLVRRFGAIKDAVDASEETLDFGDYVIDMDVDEMREINKHAQELRALVADLRATATKLNTYFDSWYERRWNELLLTKGMAKNMKAILSGKLDPSKIDLPEGMILSSQLEDLETDETNLEGSGEVSVDDETGADLSGESVDELKEGDSSDAFSANEVSSFEDVLEEKDSSSDDFSFDGLDDSF